MFSLFDVVIFQGVYITILFNGYIFLQCRLAQHGLSILEVGGEGDCFFRAVSHQVYDKPNYHMNIGSVGVQYMRANSDGFIESIRGDS